MAGVLSHPEQAVPPMSGRWLALGISIAAGVKRFADVYWSRSVNLGVPCHDQAQHDRPAAQTSPEIGRLTFNRDRQSFLQNGDAFRPKGSDGV
jgi:hypothetical protein